MSKVLRILYVSDKKETSLLIEPMLRKYGIDPVLKWIPHASGFINILREFNPGLLLCDKELSSAAPLEILQILKKYPKQIPFILLAENFTEEEIISMAKEGMDDYVLKDRLPMLPGVIDSFRVKQNLYQQRTLQFSSQETNNGIDPDHFKSTTDPDHAEKKTAENLLRKSEANLRTIFDNTNVAYVLSDPEFRVISFNPSAVTIYKKEFKVDIKEGDILLDYLPEERKILSKERFEKAMNGEKVNYEMNFLQAEGNKNWYNVNMFAVRDKINNLLGFIISSEDITARKNIELERTKMLSDIVQHNKDLEQFSYIVSHNLRSPVANIIGLSNIVKNATEMSKKDFERCVDGMVLSASKLDEIIVDLNFILQKRREIEEKKETVSFSSLLNDVKTIISELLDRERIVINSNFTINKFFTVRSYLHSIFLNLITNSIKYRNRSVTTVINIHSYKIDNKIVLIFEDNGLGIDMKNYGDKLFGLYKKFHVHIEGKGMGLYMVKTQIEILGGKISVQSQVGLGTKFTIEFDL